MSRPISDIELALLAADIADRESMRTFRTDDLEVTVKGDGSPVTSTDRLIERLVRELIAEHRPGDRVLGEEEGDSGTGDRCWVLDPIDGTGNYVAGSRAWGSLIALEEGDEPLVGVVSMPATHRRWWGTTAEGASSVEMRSGAHHRLTPSTTDDPSRMRWATGPALVELAGRERAQLRDIEPFGVYVPPQEWTTYPALMVAEGTLDLAVHFGHRWDHAALAAVVVAAGGEVTEAAPPADGERYAATYTNGRLAVRVDARGDAS